MPGEQEPIDAPELEATPAIEQDTPEADQTENLQLADDQDSTAETTEEQPEDDSEEFDWNGKKIRGPKGLKDSVLMHADYTRKTQEVASERQTVQQRQQALEQWFSQADEELDARATLKTMHGELEQFSKLSEDDWRKWEADDFMAAQAGFRRFQQLKDGYAQTAQQLTKLQSDRTERAKSETTKRLTETRDYAEKNIKGWSSEVDAKMTEFATNELGFDRDTLIQSYNPQTYKALHLAWLGYQALNQPAVKPAQPNVQPLKVVASKGNAPARKSFAEMSMDEYAAARKAGQG